MSKVYIERDAAIALLEEKQRSICPLGRCNRHAVYGSDRDLYDAIDADIDAVLSIPAADVVEVKHGNWSIRCKTHHDTHTGEYDEEFYLECSSCGREVWDIDPADVCNYGKLVAQYPYCHCGAKMDGGADNG